MATSENEVVEELDLLRKWRAVLGEELLAFLLGGSAGKPVEVSGSGAAPALRSLGRHSAQLEREDPRLAVALVRTVDSEGVPLAWRLRAQSGAPIVQPQGEDEIERALTRIARDVFPVLLSAPDPVLRAGHMSVLPDVGVSISLDHVVAAHPLGGHVDGLLREEAGFDADRRFVSALMTNALSDVSAGALLQAAALRFRHATSRDAGVFIELALEVLTKVRLLQQGQSVDVPAFIGLAGLPLPEGCVLELPQGRLRPRTPGEGRYAPLSLLAEAVVETTVVAMPFSSNESVERAHVEGQQRLRRLAREVILATALGEGEDEVPISCPAVAWIVELPPLGGIAAFRPLDPESGPPGRTDPITDDVLTRVQTWASRVATAELEHVGIGVDRLLRALWEQDWTDSLIDAVIAWENLLGTRAETGFRVTAALAVLCEDDPGQRLPLQKRLAKTYDARSRLVHGDPPRGSLGEHRALAVKVALEALRRLIRDRPDLLLLATSSERADRLLLGL